MTEKQQVARNRAVSGLARWFAGAGEIQHGHLKSAGAIVDDIIEVCGGSESGASWSDHAKAVQEINTHAPDPRD